MIQTAVITAGQTTSNEVILQPDGDGSKGSIWGIEVPALATDTTVSITVASAPGGTFRTLYMSDLSGAWQLASGAEDLALFVPDLAPWRYAKIVLGATQAADVTVNFVRR